MPAETALDGLVRSTLTAFADAIFASSWRGREREAVSLYATGFLQPCCRPGAAISDPTQVGIEVTVPGVKGLNPKGRVNKDLVIWPRPRMTVWNEAWQVANEPLAVLEWKLFRAGMRGTPGVSQHDLEWLTAFSRAHPQFLGYSVTVDLAAREFRMRVAQCRQGIPDPNWLEARSGPRVDI